MSIDAKEATKIANEALRKGVDGQWQAIINMINGEEDQEKARPMIAKRLADYIRAYAEPNSAPNFAIETGLSIDGEPVAVTREEARALLRVFIRRDREDFAEELKAVRLAEPVVAAAAKK